MPVRPTWWVGQGGMEDGEVDEGVGRQEEVGDDGSNDVQLSYENNRTQHTLDNYSANLI